MSQVQFDDDTDFEARKFAMQGRRSGSVPHISSEQKLLASVMIAIMIGATLYIWLKFVNASHPVINDSEITPYSAASL